MNSFNPHHLRLEILSKLFSRLPRFKGKYRLARFGFGKTLREKELTIKGQKLTKFSVPNCLEPISFAILVDGIYEPDSIKLIRHQLPENGTFIDIGANIGSFSINISRLCKKCRQIVAIEASPTIFPYLEKNIKLNALTNVKALQFAVTDRDGLIVDFYEAPKEKFGMGSLGIQFHDSPIKVKTKTLDSILEEEKIEKVDLIKIDIEGYETPAFEGARKILSSSHPPIVLFEFCDWAEARRPGGRVGDSQKILRDYGYKVWRLKDFLDGLSPLEKILVHGSEMLVGAKHGNN